MGCARAQVAGEVRFTSAKSHAGERVQFGGAVFVVPGGNVAFNASHRVERLLFGPELPDLDSAANPLSGTTKFSEKGAWVAVVLLPGPSRHWHVPPRRHPRAPPPPPPLTHPVHTIVHWRLRADILCAPARVPCCVAFRGGTPAPVACPACVCPPAPAPRSTADSSYDYFVQLVPTVVTKLSGKELRTVQYSATDFEHTPSKQGTSGPGGVQPGLAIKYDFSPIQVGSPAASATADAAVGPASLACPCSPACLLFL